MEFLPKEMHMLHSALNEIVNGVDIPEFEIRLGASKQEYQKLLNEVSLYYGWQLVVMNNWNEFDPIGVYQSGGRWEDPYEYAFYVNPTLELILQKENFDLIRSFVVDICENNIGMLPTKEKIDTFVNNLVELQTKICHEQILMQER